MKRPSFQFYPADWAANPNLKRCTFAEKGIWLEVMCLLHDQAEYGVLRWTLQEIATAVKCRAADLRALHRKGVIKGDDQSLREPFVYTPRSGRRDGAPVTLVPVQDGPIWFSSRMVKDEYVRALRGDGGGASDAPKPTPYRSPKPTIGEPIGGGLGPRGSSSSSSASPPSEERTSEGRAKRGGRLSEAWAPGPEDTSYAITQGFSEPEIARIGERFRNYWLAQPGQKGVKLDWRATWRNWILEQADRRGPATPRRVSFV